MYRYANSSNQSSFRSNVPMSNDQIAQYAPSVLAGSAHESRGRRYTFIPTINVIDGLRGEGFHPYEVRQTRVRDQGKREYTKHMVRLRHESSIGQEEVPEIVLLNSHDGTSSYQLLAGIFRFICSNGLISGDVFSDIRIRHSGNVVDDCIEGSFRVLDNTKELSSRIESYKAITLSDQEETEFAEAALKLKWENDAPIKPCKVLVPHRYQDHGRDLWTTFNRIQENMLNGGLRGRTATGRRTTTRAVGGVNENVRLNKALWTLADRLAKIKESGDIAIAA